MWCQEPLTRLKWMAVLVDAAQGLKGGALASCIHSYTKQGDPAVQTFVQRILHEVSQPLFSIIKAWMIEGDLIDPH
jgi:gamma-tubulin complex component 3